MILDPKLTELIRIWLVTEPDERNYVVGALYLLKLSGNKIMYQNLVSRDSPQSREAIEYQLKKYYAFRLAQVTHEQVEEMAAQVESIVADHIPDEPDAEKLPRGKREDHDQLPDEIKALFLENLSILQRMRELHLKLRSLSLENATCPDSERFPFLKELIRLDKNLHSNWEQYDRYIPANETDSKPKRNSKTARSKA